MDVIRAGLVEGTRPAVRERARRSTHGTESLAHAERARRTTMGFSSPPKGHGCRAGLAHGYRPGLAHGGSDVGADASFQKFGRLHKWDPFLEIDQLDTVNEAIVQGDPA